jgi:hypothetical protein
MDQRPELLLSLAHERTRALRSDAARRRLRSAVARARARTRQHRATDDPAG